MSVVYSHALKYSQEMDSNNINSGLLRYRSAPSSMLTSLMDNIHDGGGGGGDEEALRTELEKLISSNNKSKHVNNSSEHLKREEGNNNYNYSFGSQNHVIYQNNQHYHQIHQGLAMASSYNNGFDGTLFGATNSMDSENNNDNGTQNKMGSNLIRQKSSPAGFFSNYSIDNNGTTTSSRSSSGLQCTLNFSSRSSSCSKSRMPQIVESGNEGMESNCVENRNLIIRNDDSNNNNNNNGSTKCYMPRFTGDVWDASEFNSSKRGTNNGEIMFSTSNAMEAQDVDFGYQKVGLTHHLSLPSSSTKIGGMEKLFQIQGSAPCKIRAKRGFATHPRSIAERERRTRISARIKKLQDLFPKSDKQTSTADMLDLAVDYIKGLQKQVKILTDTRAKCNCSSNYQKEQ
ncbi:hypothetical protein HN51_020257 [Arachis hypogaea]|uniref:transcription factor bHLH130 n=1 Tax=Arachis hypogaea TaxID=3818 RepID=UPI000DEC7455|nr:transcription factor bHLH130 [Arachis hypogaea]QHO32169.1 Transcription factor [Arachis hypogaea]